MIKISNINMQGCKLGLAAFDSITGLGNQTRAYYDHLNPYRTLVSDISAFNHQPRYPHWYDQNDPEQFEVIFDIGFPSREVIDKFLAGLDVILVAENPLNYYMFQRARELGIKSILVPNFEFLEFLRTPILPKPDLFLVPSVWRINEIEQFGPTKYLHFPVDRDLLPYREIKEFVSFLHNIGNPAVHDRNGTLSILDAIIRTKDPKVCIQIVAPSIEILETIPKAFRNLDPRIYWGLSTDIENYWNLYEVGSVLVLPRRYGGNCLPMNEALSVGMPVIMTDLNPQNTFLPKEWLVPARPKDSFKARTDIEIYEADPKALAEKMEWFANLNSDEMLVESKKADALAETISWTTLLPQYEEVIRNLL